jgi:peptidoglycan-associated lipoprotein
MQRHGSKAGLYILAGLMLTACARDMETQLSAPALSPISQMTSSMLPNQAPSATSPAAASAGIVAGSLRDFQQNVGDRVRFDYDRSDLGPDARDTLRKQVAWLLRYPSVTLIVEGHADERGTREYNLALAARCASAVTTFLVTMGVNSARLETISYGKERPSCSQSTDECWNENRRGVSTIKDGAVTVGS